MSDPTPASRLRATLANLTSQIKAAEEERTEVDGRLFSLRAERYDVARSLREMEKKS